MKIALYKSLTQDYVCIQNAETFDKIGGYFRISQIVDVEFKSIESTELKSTRLSLLNEKERIQCEHHKTALNKINAEREKLLGIAESP